jgi:CHAD domain-containing protein
MMLLKKTPLWIASKGLLAERGSDFFHCLEKTSATLDPEDIHDLRVASRRLREGLSLFKRSYPQKRISCVRKAVREITNMLGDLRNIDEYCVFLRDEAIELGEKHGTELAGSIDRYLKKRKEAQKQLKRDLRKVKPLRLRKYFVRTIHVPYLFDPSPDANDPFCPIDVFARENIDQRLSLVLSLIPEARFPEKALVQHRLRIAVKHYRYRIEVLSPFMDAGYHELHGHVKEYQEILGRIHDLDVFAELVRGMTLSSGTEKALLNLVAIKREKTFSAFSAKLGTMPFEVIGANIRSLL